MRLRDIMPKSLFGRSLFIVGLPIIFLQIFLGYFFFERHWDDVGRRLVLAVAGEIALISENIILAENNPELLHPKKSRLDRALSKSLKERIKFPHTFNTIKNLNKVLIYVQLPNKV